MWEDVNSQLDSLRLQMEEKKRCASQLDEVERELREEKEKNASLRALLDKDEALADKLRKASLVHLFHAIVGNLEEDEEQLTAKTVQTKIQLDASDRAISHLSSEVERIRSRQIELKYVEDDYQRRLAIKAEEIAKTDGSVAKKLAELSEDRTQLLARKHEIYEARSAARSAEYALRDCLDTLKKAGRWGTADLLGGGMIITAIKRDYMDQANENAIHAQNALRTLARELKDVRVALSVPLHSEGFGRFADYFFDGLIADWSAQSEIRESESAVSTALDQVEDIVGKMEKAAAAIDKQITNVETERDELIAKAK